MIFGSHRLLRPSWIISHIFVLALIVSTINLGFWQLRRLEERKSNNSQISEVINSDPIKIDTVVSGGIGTAQNFLPVTAKGTFDENHQFYLINRSRDGAPGVEVITLFKLTTEPVSYVAVNRGYLPSKIFNNDQSETWKPASREVQINGFVMLPFSDGKLNGNEINRIDIDLLSDEWDVSLLPVYLQETQKSDDQWPLGLDPPELTEGPHLAYAVQWFIFSVIGLIGYPLVLRRVVADDRLVA